MKTYWKWILGILIALVVIVAIPVGMHVLMSKGYIAPPVMFARYMGQTGAFDMPYGFNGGNGPRGFEDYRGWDHHGRGHGFFGPFMFIGGLLKLAVFGGLLYGAYWLGRRNARVALDPAPAVPDPSPKRSGKTAKK